MFDQLNETIFDKLKKHGLSGLTAEEIKILLDLLKNHLTAEQRVKLEQQLAVNASNSTSEMLMLQQWINQTNTIIAEKNHELDVLFNQAIENQKQLTFDLEKSKN